LIKIDDPMNATTSELRVLVHLSAGIGNVVLATPLLLTLFQYGLTIDVLVDGDYPDTAELLLDWSALRAVFGGSRGRPDGRSYEVVIPAIPPFYWSRYARAYRGMKNIVPRPPDRAFYRDEQDYYLGFARTLGCTIDPPPYCFLPIAPDLSFGVSATTLVLAPGCKTGEMAAKRWPHFPALAESFADVVLVGTQDDLHHGDGHPMRFPRHVRSLVGQLSLRKTAEVLAAGGVVVANDSGIGHIAAAVGVQTILVFGPTPDRTLGRLPGNAIVLRNGLPCEPCWFGARFVACGRRITCLGQLSAPRVAAVLHQLRFP
jgi:ADP-heptose:LPS heptosyltransferase